jgi:hypothetical protein
MVGHNLALRRQLAPIEARIHAAATQQVVDRAGLELGSLTSVFTRELLAARASDMHPAMLDYLERVSSGEHQWEGIQGSLAMSATGAIGSVLSNYLFPATGELNLVFRNLPLQADQAAAAAAAGLVTLAEADQTAGAWGNTPETFQLMYQLAQQIPGAAQLLDMHHRGLISDQDLAGWLQRTGIPPGLIAAVTSAGQQLLSPADAALAVVRNIMPLADGLAVAAANGLSAADFNILVMNQGEPLALEEMLLLYRWGKMDKATLEQGIRESDVRDAWIPYAEMLGIVPPSGAEVVNAVIRGQISDAEGQERWHIAGGDPTWYETAVTSSANPPSPTELAQMVHRGLIPWEGVGPDVTSFQQGIYEGDTKDKWEPLLRANAVYYPPPREIATLVKEGGMTQDQAMKLWQEAGLTADLAHQYWLAAHYNKTSTVHQLAQGEIVALYTDKAIDHADALKMLESVNWTPGDAEWLLDIADLKTARAALESAISKIRGLYIAWKISATTAKAALAALDVPATQAGQLTDTWNLERGANIKVLTAAEITDAWYYQLIAPADAQQLLEQIGYTPYDAWLLLNIKNKGPIADYPQPAGS